MEQNIQSKNYPLTKPFVERRVFKGGFNDLTQFALDVERWIAKNPGKCAIDYLRTRK